MNEELIEGNDVDDQPKLIVKNPHACEYAQLLSNFVGKPPLEFLIVDVMNMQSFMNKLKKMSSCNVNKHPLKTIDSKFHNV